MRTRPCFEAWELKFIVLFDDTIVEEAQIRSFLELSGRVIGLADWRPKHGRFEVVK